MALKTVNLGRASTGRPLGMTIRRPRGFPPRVVVKLVARCLAVLLAVSTLLAFAVEVEAQSGTLIRARLASAPPLGVPRETVAGSGAVWWTLNGSTLEIDGSFERLASAATIARIHMGPFTAVRGEPVFDLTVRKTADETSGLIGGSVELSPEQVQALRDGRFYVQLYSEGTENGHLQGWLLQ